VKSTSWLAGLVVAGAALTAGPAAFASTHPAIQLSPAATVVHGVHAAAGIRLPGTVRPPLIPNRPVRNPFLSGYAAIADRGRNIRYIAADFTVPALTCSPLGSKGTSDVNYSVGLDGINDATSEAIGVFAFCDSTGANYSGFYDMAPRQPVFFGGIAPGDSVMMSVFFTGRQYRLILQNLTTGDIVKKTFQRCPRRSRCLNKSAEVLTEGGGDGSDLANFGTVSYTSVSVTSVRGKRGTLRTLRKYWKSAEFVMVNGSGQTLAAPSALHSRGRAFGVSWVAGS
jgi:hypothetical protein